MKMVVVVVVVVMVATSFGQVYSVGTGSIVLAVVRVGVLVVE